MRRDRLCPIGAGRGGKCWCGRDPAPLRPGGSLFVGRCGLRDLSVSGLLAASPGPAPEALPGARPQPLTAQCFPAAMSDELSDLLREFDEVVEGFDRGPASQYERHLEEVKRKAGHNVYDSGIDELESECGAAGHGGVPEGGIALRALGLFHDKRRIFLLVQPLGCLSDPTHVGRMSNAVSGRTVVMAGSWSRGCQHLLVLLLQGCFERTGKIMPSNLQAFLLAREEWTV